MTLTLTEADQARLATAVRALSSPVAGAVGRWRDEAMAATAAAAGRGAGVFIAPAWTELMGARTIDDASLDEYSASYLPYLLRTGVFARCLRLGVATRREAYGPRYHEIDRSAYAQEFLPSIGSFDSITWTAPIRPAPRHYGDVVQLAVISPDRGRPLGDRPAAVSRILYPALVAGVRSYVLLRGARDRLRMTVDATGAPCLVADRDGVVVHRTPVLERALALEPARDRVLAAAERLALRFFGPRPSAVETVAGRRGRYRLSATEVHDGGEPYVVVVVERVREGAHAPDAVAGRHGLTPRQAEVAVLLAERRTNKEIAAALCVSVHTARHHVAAVLAALNVPRAEVGRALRERDGAR